jgi:hypothetical protein
MKTDIDIKDDVYLYLKNSALATEVTGKLCKTIRPAASTAEDIVVSVLANENGQVQSAYVNVNIYVADQLHKYAKESQYEENSQRLRALCQLAHETLERHVGDDYRWELESQRVMAVEGRNEHCINNRILYKCCNE